MELSLGGGSGWLDTATVHRSGAHAPARHDEYDEQGVGTFTWPPAGTSPGQQWGLSHGHGHLAASGVLLACGAAFFLLRFVGGGASALVFVFAVSAMQFYLRHADHPVGWGVRRGRCRHRAVRRAGIDHRLNLVVVRGVVVVGPGHALPFWTRGDSLHPRPKIRRRRRRTPSASRPSIVGSRRCMSPTHWRASATSFPARSW